MVLTEKQRDELHSAVYEYLLGLGEGFRNSATVFAEEAKLGDDHRSTSAGLLEKKWTSVVRLQRKVMELEQKLQQAEADLRSAPGTTGANKKQGDSRQLPRGPPRQTLVGHRSPILALAVHPVYSIVASGSEDATIRVWDYESGEYERQLKGHTSVVQDVSFNQTGSMLVSCSSDLSLKLWDFQTYECVKTLRGHDHNVSCARFLPSGEQIVSCSRDTSIKFWEVSTGYCLRTLCGHTDWVRSLAISSDGTLLASCGNDQTAAIWQLESAPSIGSNAQANQPLMILRDHTHVVECVAFAPSKKRQAPSAPGSQVSSTDAFSVSNEDPTKGALAMAEISNGPSQGELIATGSRDRSVKLWDVFSGLCLMTFSDHDNWVRGIIYHPSGNFLISCSDDRSIRVFDIKNRRCIRAIDEAHAHFVTSIAMSSTSAVLVSGRDRKSVV